MREVRAKSGQGLCSKKREKALREMCKMKPHSWMTTRMIADARARLRECPDPDVREEGLACLRKAKPEYLCNLIKADHPDRAAALRWLAQ